MYKILDGVLLEREHLDMLFAVPIVDRRPTYSSHCRRIQRPSVLTSPGLATGWESR